MTALFVERGFDAVTVEEAARAAGISRATFFRYFDSKEDAVLATLNGPGADYAATLRALPDRPGETTWQLLERTFRTALAGVDQKPEPDRARLRMIQGTASLRARLTSRRFENVEPLADALAERGVSAEAANTIVTAAFMGVAVAWRRWALDASLTWQDTLAEIFAHLSSANAPLPEVTADPA